MEHCSVNIPNDNTFAIVFLRELGKLYEAMAEFKTPKVMSSSVLQLLLSEGDNEVSSVAQTSQLCNTDPLAPKKADFPTLTAYLNAKKAYNATKGDAVTGESSDFSVEL